MKTAVLAFGAVLFVMYIPHPESIAPNIPQISFNATKLCPNATQNLDFTDLQDDNFAITLSEGCFGNWVHIPKSWSDWKAKPRGNPTGYWIAHWFANEERGVGPFFANNGAHLTDDAHALFRVQGHGDVLFYTNHRNNSPTPSSESGNPQEPLPSEPPPPQLREPVVTTALGDPRQCGGKELNTTDFPDPHYNKYLKKPKVLFAGHEADTIEWPRGFQGTIPVCFVIGVDGLATDVRLIQSPGQEFEEKISLKLSADRWEPATLRETHQGTPVPVPITMEVNFIFK